MGLDGGGGGGTILGAGDAFTGPAEALEIYGDFAAAYSGFQQINTSPVEHLKFNTGNYLFVGELTLIGSTKLDSQTSGNNSVAQISFNGSVVFNLKVESENEDMPADATIPFLIPAFTTVEIDVQTDSSAANFGTSVNLIGRIYR